ncbi:flagellar assembly protein A [Clostridium hydrogeniformans]|uniref:flagellar assembly protein A n=1 Tax=Clostridium hydrogeniformans TaxID=349933 RepID=UPI0004870C97|nr:flagellar assembly protein A [Clostridium hydrogeniformans]
MDEKIFCGKSLEECIIMACNELMIPKEELKYEIIKKKGLFKKRVTIEIKNSQENILDKDQIQCDDGLCIHVQKDNQSKDIDGKVSIIDGIIKVINPKEGGEPSVIIIPPNIEVKIDGKLVNGRVEVKEENNIEVFLVKEEGRRNLKVTLSEKDMKAYASITYNEEKTYKLKDASLGDKAILELELVSKIMPPRFTKDDIVKELKSLGIVHGILEDNIEKLSKENSVDLSIVSIGEEAVDEKEDRIEIKFNIDKKKFNEDELGNIDYKNIGAIDRVEENVVIAQLYEGEKGKDGRNIRGKAIPHKRKKKVIFKAGKGASQKDDIIVSTLAGKPVFKSGVFEVHPVHEVNGDVNIETGNIEYSGDVIVKGNVVEGMKVRSGNELVIFQGVTHADIEAEGNIEIKGKVISSKIIGGGQDVYIVSYIDILSELSEKLLKIIEVIMEIKKYDMGRKKKTDGEIIKSLFEGKFKEIPKLCNNLLKEQYLEDDIKSILVKKLMFLAPLNIKHFSELDDIIKIIDFKIKDLKERSTIKTDITVDYVQDTTIKSTGNVYITGKGQYICNITCNGLVEFKKEGAIARGGVIYSKKEIKAEEVGSVSGVSTKLMVDKNGHIFVKKAFGNTKFIVGNREYILDYESKNIHAYMDSSGDIVVDKLKA